MHKILLAGAALLLLLAGCGREPSAPADGVDPASAMAAALDLITPEGIRAHVAYLAADELEGREAGEPGYDLAAAYVAGQFAAIGLEPGGDDGWFQQVPLLASQLDTDNFALTIHRDGEDLALSYRDDFGGYGDRVRSEVSVRAEVVYVGFGVHAPELGYSDYEGVDVSGRIVAFFDNAPATLPSDQRAYYSSSRTKEQEAVSRGAVATIGLRSQRSDELFPWERVRQVAGKKPGMEWRHPDGSVSDFHPEILGRVYLNSETAAALLADAPITFEAARAATEASTPASVPLGFEATIATRTSHRELTSPNVIGVVPGTDPVLAAEYVVFTGHLDHDGIGEPVEGSDDRIYNGAYDNAMGIGLMIEAARAIAANPPRRSVMFIGLAAEEKGLLGSDYFARYPTVPVDAIVANVNLDMPLFLFPLRDLVGFGAEHTSLQEPMAAAATAEGFTLVPDPMPEEVLFVRSDQYSFVRQGIPASYLDSGFGALDPELDGEAIIQAFVKDHYHKPSDDLSQPVDWDSARRFSRANARIGFAVANADARPTWNEGDFFGERFARGR